MSSEPVWAKIQSNPLTVFTVVNVVLLLLTIGVYLWVFFGYLKKDWVDRKNCVAPTGEFSVEPGSDVSTTLELCPDSSSGNDKCIFTVDNLLDATLVCNQKADICSKFVFNPSSKQMKIVSLKGIPRQSGSDFNTYTRQANVTFRTNRTGTVSEQTVSFPDNTISVAADGTVDLNSISVTATMV
jgi:hypothetical protein